LAALILVAALSGCATVMQDAGLGPAKDANGMRPPPAQPGR